MERLGRMTIGALRKHIEELEDEMGEIRDEIRWLREDAPAADEFAEEELREELEELQRDHDRALRELDYRVGNRPR